MIPKSKWSLVKSLLLAIAPCALMVLSLNFTYGAYHFWEEPFSFFGGTLVPGRIEVLIWFISYVVGLIFVRVLNMVLRDRKSLHRNDRELFT